MLFFRSEEHVDRWCRSWHLDRGAILSLDTAWRLARTWFTDRRPPHWRRRTVDEIEQVFGELGLEGEFWKLR